MDELRISVSPAPQPEVIVLRLDGSLDTLTAPQLDQAITGLLRQNRYKFVLDLAGVDYISSAGWGILVSHLKEIRHNQGDLKLSRLLPQVQEIFELLEFDSIIKWFDSPEAALEDFKSNPSSIVKSASDGIGKSSLQGERVYAPPIPGTSHLQKAKPENNAGGLDGKVLALVQDDPLLRISQIKLQLDTPRFGDLQVSSFKVWRILKRHKLLRLRQRCLFARQNGKSFSA